VLDVSAAGSMRPLAARWPVIPVLCELWNRLCRAPRATIDGRFRCCRWLGVAWRIQLLVPRSGDPAGRAGSAPAEIGEASHGMVGSQVSHSAEEVAAERGVRGLSSPPALRPVHPELRCRIRRWRADRIAARALATGGNRPPGVMPIPAPAANMESGRPLVGVDRDALGGDRRWQCVSPSLGDARASGRACRSHRRNGCPGPIAIWLGFISRQPPAGDGPTAPPARSCARRLGTACWQHRELPERRLASCALTALVHVLDSRAAAADQTCVADAVARLNFQYGMVLPIGCASPVRRRAETLQ